MDTIMTAILSILECYVDQYVYLHASATTIFIRQYRLHAGPHDLTDLTI